MAKFHEKNIIGVVGAQIAQGVPLTDSVRTHVTFGGTITAAQTVIFDGLTYTAATTSLAAIATYFKTQQASTNYEFQAGHDANSILVIAKQGVNDIAITSGSFTGTSATLTKTLIEDVLSPKGALPVSTLTGDPEFTFGTVTYLGDLLSRYEYSYMTDRFANLQLDTPEQILSTSAATVGTSLSNLSTIMGTAANCNIGAPFISLLEACGAYISIYTAAIGSGTNQLFANGAVVADNSRVSNAYHTIDIRKSSPDDSNDKLTTFYDLLGSVDFTIGVSTLPMCKFSMNGNVFLPWLKNAPLAYNGVAKQVIADYGDQFKLVAPSILPENIGTSQVLALADVFSSAWAGTLSYKRSDGSTAIAGNTSDNVVIIKSTTAHGRIVGDLVNVKISVGTADANYANYSGQWLGLVISDTEIRVTLQNAPSADPSVSPAVYLGANTPTAFGFGSLTANNFFGFEYSRFVTSLQQGYTKKGAATDVNTVMLEDQANSTAFDPDANMSSFFAMQVRIGKRAGSYVTRIWNSLQIKAVKGGSIGEYRGRDVNFRNTGISTIIYH